MNSYNSLSTTIEYAGLKREISLKRGVNQGDPLLPFIFNAIMDPLLEQLEQMKGYVIDESHSLSALAFANDLTLLATAKDQAQNLLHHTESYLKSLGMGIAADKCASFEISTKDSWYIANPDLRLANGEKYHPQQQIAHYAISEATSLHGLGCSTKTLWASLRPH
jgi:hypothetical protein